MAFVLRALIAKHELAAAAEQRLGVEYCPLTEDLSLVPLLARGEDPGRAESSEGDPIFLLTPAEEHLAVDVSLRERSHTSRPRRSPASASRPPPSGATAS